MAAAKIAARDAMAYTTSKKAITPKTKQNKPKHLKQSKPKQSPISLAPRSQLPLNPPNPLPLRLNFP